LRFAFEARASGTLGIYDEPSSAAAAAAVGDADLFLGDDQLPEDYDDEN
jgi:hypothetical protein